VRLFAGWRRSLSLCLAAASLAGVASGLLGTCGPFTDVAADAFCPFVLEIFTLGITAGTTPTTYDPASNVSRLQMSAFLSRSVDAVLRRGSRRAAIGRFAIPQSPDALGLTTVGSFAYFAMSDGADLWVPFEFGSIARVRASDGRLLETWTGAGLAFSAVAAMERVLVSGGDALYAINPAQPPGAVTTVASGLGMGLGGMAFDGGRLFIAHQTPTSSVSIVVPGNSIPWSASSVTAGLQDPLGAVFDGSDVWVTDALAGTLLKLDSSGTILQTVTVGFGPEYPRFDGENIFVPADGNFVAVVRPSTGTVLTMLTGNGLNHPVHAAFDGERILVSNNFGDSVSLWKAADLTPLGAFSTGTGSAPWGACSDGFNFWVVLQGTGRLARF
jgi:DNA-binding beta-propeller fold protein YncE